MLQCRACNGWNEDSAAFCSQCGQSTGRKGRGGLRLPLTVIVFTALGALTGFMATWLLLDREALEPAALPSVEKPVAQGPPLPGKSSPPAERPAPGKPPAPAADPISIGEVTPSNPQPRRVDVGRSRATLVLFDKEGSPTRQMPAVVVHPDGVRWHFASEQQRHETYYFGSAPGFVRGVRLETRADDGSADFADLFGRCEIAPVLNGS